MCGVLVFCMINNLKLEIAPKEGYWGRQGAGAIYLSKKTWRFLFGLRSDMVNEGGTWGGFGGKVDEGENPKQSVMRELEEETGYNGSLSLYFLYLYEDEGFKYFNYIAVVPDEFEPRLNWENDDYKWVEFGDWPQPLHFGTEEMLRHSLGKLKSLYDARQNLKEATNPQNQIKLNKLGLVPPNWTEVDYNVNGYELKSLYSYLKFGHSPSTRTFFIYNIGTDKEHQNKGYAKALLDTFFKMVKKQGGVISVGPYTISGDMYIKSTIERLAQQYGVRLIK